MTGQFLNKFVSKEIQELIEKQKSLSDATAATAVSYVPEIAAVVPEKKDFLKSLKQQNPDLPASFSEKTFENFNDRGSKKILNIREILQTWDYPKERASIFMSGKSGLGKTHLMFALLKRFAEKYFSKHGGLNSNVKWFNYFDLCLQIRANPNDLGFWKHLKNVEILFIDDVGTIKNTDVIQDYLMATIDYRTQNDKITIWSTNLTADELKKHFSERFTSRIKESSLWLEFPEDVADFRNIQFSRNLETYKERLSK